MSTKLCVMCSEPLPPMRRSDRRYCGVLCRVKAHAIRAGAGSRPGKARRSRRPADSVGNACEGPTIDPNILNALQQKLDDALAQLLKKEAIEAELKEQLARVEDAITAQDSVHQEQEAFWREQLADALAETEAVRATSALQLDQAHDREKILDRQLEKRWSQLRVFLLAEAKAEQAKHTAPTSLSRSETRGAHLQNKKMHPTAVQQQLEELDYEVRILRS